ncbi:ABC transporter permease [Microbacterium sp. NPDC056044]|uniref:ABC transporter permease n=1 Tax=Microbacterium sp. NPDC056044 TaxID=3345690 RepID=UPI0035DDE303
MTSTQTPQAPPSTSTQTIRIRARLRSVSPVTYAAVALVTIFALVAIFAPLLAPYDPLAQDPAHRFTPPFTESHLFGTDQYGRDILSRLIFGARVELVTALAATGIAAVVGTAIGLIAGYAQGATRSVMMRSMDVLLTFPPLILALFAVTLYGQSMGTLILALALLFVPGFARVAYGQTLSVRSLEYVEAARLYGAKTPVILAGVILPNVAAPLLVRFSLTIAAAILLESGLSYLGLGIVPPEPSWGSMVAEGQRYMSTAPFVLLVPAITVVVSILAFSLLGDGIREWLDPRSRRNAK